MDEHFCRASCSTSQTATIRATHRPPVVKPLAAPATRTLLHPAKAMGSEVTQISTILMIASEHASRQLTFQQTFWLIGLEQ